jgi:hypothetical protein
MPILSVCHDNSFAERIEDERIESADNSSSKRWRKLPGHARETWRITWANLGLSDLTSIRSVFEAAGYTGRIEWQPPNEGSTRPFRVMSYVDAALSANTFQARMELLSVPGI